VPASTHGFLNSQTLDILYTDFTEPTELFPSFYGEVRGIRVQKEDLVNHFERVMHFYILLILSC
jgi:hypothetical protein